MLPVRASLKSFVVALVLVAFFATSSAFAIDYKYINNPKEDLGSDGKKIKIIEGPLAGAPNFTKPDKTMTIELDDGASIDKPLSVWLKPSFGEAREKVNLNVTNISNNQPSDLWPNRQVTKVTVELPSLNSDFKPGLYDVHVKWKEYWGLITKKDLEPRAVNVVKSYPDDPKVALIGDPQVGDPRALLEATKETFNDGDLEVFEMTWDEVIGDLSPGDRWAAFQKTIQEISAQDPDFVVFSGDLMMGVEYGYEFEDAYRLLNQFKVPTYVSPGNHDAYNHALGPDGQKKWKKYFGPLYYSVDIGSDIHLTSINSFDWSSLERTALRVASTIWGGSVNDKQLDWLETDLTSWRSNNPDGMLLTFAHHDPSWEQSPTVLDSLIDLEMPQDQRWSGDNRLELRKLLNKAKVDAHLAGHIHGDELSRYIDDGSQYGKLALTLENDCVTEVDPEKGDLNDDRSIEKCKELEDMDNSEDNQSRLRSDLRDYNNGPLFVKTTTVSSSTGDYWGWRMVEMNRNDGYYSWWYGYQRGGIDPSIMSYPMTKSHRNQAVKNQTLSWLTGQTIDQELRDLGLYSSPSYMLDVQKVTDNATRETFSVENNLKTPASGELIMSLNTCSSISVTNGDKIWTREDKDAERTDVKVGYSVDAGQTIEITANSWEGTSSCDDSSSWW
ncbi:MAG: metallophosphoesterase [bacterium]